VASFRAEVVFRFEAESLETAGRELRRLQLLVRDAGFELKSARVEPNESDQGAGSGGGIPYAPIEPE